MNATLDATHEASTDVVAPKAEFAPASVDPYKLASTAVGLGGAVLAFILIRFTVDDAFISWRYGLSLAHGVWNWNADSQYPVEAYSNPLFTLLSVVPALTGMPAELFFKLVGIGLLIGGLFVVRALPVPRLQRLVLAACALLNPIFFVHLFSGLETASFALGLAALFGLLYVRGTLGVLGHLLALAVALTRPEGMLFALVAETWCLHLNRRRVDLAALGGMAAVLAGYWWARASYFGAFFPNPYLFKSASTMGNPNKVAHAGLGLAGMFVVLAGLGVGLEAVRRLRLKGRPGVTSSAASPWRDATPAVFAATVALLVMVLYRVSSLQMDFGNRFRWQLLFPVALVLLARPLFADASDEPGSAAGTGFGRQSRGGHDQDEVSENSADVAFHTESTMRNAASPRWIALTVLIAGLTAITGAAPYATGHAGATALAYAACLIAAAIWIFGNRVPTLLAVTALIAAVSMTSVTEILNWSVYRYHLAAAHEKVALALAADPSLHGVIAVEDAGMLAYHLRPDQQALDLSGLADPFYAHPPVPDAVTGRLVAVVAGSGQPSGPDMWWGDGSSPTVFRTAGTQHFRQIGSVMYAPGYWLKIIAAPGHGDSAASALATISAASVKTNGESNGFLLGRRLFDLPFLHG